jgi:hypothetical protein
MNGSNKTHWFALDNEQALAQLKDDFWDVFLAKLRQAVESGALSEKDTKDYAMTVARCVLVITGESMVPRSDKGKKMLANLRHFV